MTGKELEKIYNEAYRAVYWTAMSLLKNEADAEDVVQDTFVTLIESYDTIQDKSKVTAWLKKIAANKCLNRLTRTKTDSVEDEFFDDVEAVAEDFLPDSLVESEEMRRIVMDIINNKLSEDIRRTLILFYFDEMSTKEIAEALGIPQGTVSWRLNFAKKTIKKEVEKYEKDHDTKLFAVMALPFLSKLFIKEAEQVAFKAMPASLMNLSASAKVPAKGAGTKIASQAAKKGTGIMAKKIIIGSIAAVVAVASITGAIIFITKNTDKTPEPMRREKVRDDDDDNDRKETKETDVETEPSDPSVAFVDYESYEITTTYPFNEGRAWCEFKNGNGKLTYALIDTNGVALYTNSEFRDSDERLVIDGLTYLTQVDFDDEGTAFIILDKDGHELYSEVNSEDESFVIAGYYDGLFLVEKHTSSFDANDFSLYTIDKNGNQVGTIYVTSPTDGGLICLGDGKFFFVPEDNMAFIIDLPAGGATPVQDADEIYSLRESRVPAIPFFDAEYDGQWKYCTAEHRSYTLPQFNISWGYASGDYCAYCIYGADDDLYSVLCDTDGNIIGDPVRGSLLGISNGYAAVRNTDNELLFIGPDGRVITDSEYASLPAGLWIVDDDLRDEWVIAGDFINYSITKDGHNIDGYLSIDSSKLIDSVKVPF